MAWGGAQHWGPQRHPLYGGCLSSPSWFSSPCMVLSCSSQTDSTDAIVEPIFFSQGGWRVDLDPSDFRKRVLGSWMKFWMLSWWGLGFPQPSSLWCLCHCLTLCRTQRAASMLVSTTASSASTMVCWAHVTIVSAASTEDSRGAEESVLSYLLAAGVVTWKAFPPPPQLQHEWWWFLVSTWLYSLMPVVSHLQGQDQRISPLSLTHAPAPTEQLSCGCSPSPLPLPSNEAPT